LTKSWYRPYAKPKRTVYAFLRICRASATGVVLSAASAAEEDQVVVLAAVGEVFPGVVDDMVGADRLGEEAHVLAGEHAAIARAWGANRPLARALRVQGLTLGGEDGTALLHESVEVAQDSPGGWSWRCRWWNLARPSARANRRAAAREPLEEGLALAHQCGARALQERALAELLAAGARPGGPRQRPRHPHPSELRIAGLAGGAGADNRQIAQRLFITQKPSRPISLTPSASCRSTPQPRSPRPSPADGTRPDCPDSAGLAKRGLRHRR
jgi:hypothetical protein